MRPSKFKPIQAQYNYHITPSALPCCAIGGFYLAIILGTHRKTQNAHLAVTKSNAQYHNALSRSIDMGAHSIFSSGSSIINPYPFLVS
jgi:hypothetical protein